MDSKGVRPELFSLPFPPLLNKEVALEEFSLRLNTHERPTVHYFLEEAGKRYRVKEFFMDWFYTGFPKSLMKTLVDAYSEIEYAPIGQYRVFFGRNYKGNSSISFYSRGTTVEIECYEDAKTEDFHRIVADMSFGPYLTERFRDAGFVERSFLASGGSGLWWEDSRIAGMEWRDIEPGKRNNHFPDGLKPLSLGTLKVKGGFVLRTLILADSYMERSVWIELVNLQSSEKNGYYNFRKGSGLFNEFNESDFLLCFRSPEGPGAVQFQSDQTMATFAFSPGFSSSSIEQWADKREDLVKRATAFFT